MSAFRLPDALVGARGARTSPQIRSCPLLAESRLWSQATQSEHYVDLLGLGPRFEPSQGPELQSSRSRDSL